MPVCFFDQVDSAAIYRNAQRRRGIHRIRQCRTEIAHQKPLHRANIRLRLQACPLFDFRQAGFCPQIALIQAPIGPVGDLAGFPRQPVPLQTGICNFARLLAFRKYDIRDIPFGIKGHGVELPALHIVDHNLAVIDIGLQNEAAFGAAIFHIPAQILDYPLILAVQILCPLASRDARLHLDGHQTRNFAGNRRRKAQGLHVFPLPWRAVLIHIAPKVYDRQHLRRRRQLDAQGRLYRRFSQHSVHRLFYSIPYSHYRIIRLNTVITKYRMSSIA